MLRKDYRLALGFAAVLLLAVGVYAYLRPAGLPPDLIPPAGAYDVRILRDTWGVPHVFGRTDADVAYGLAWAHAEDDFPTLQGALLAARGKLAAAFGKDAAPNDYMVALLGVREAVAEGYPRLSPETRALCEAYADGLNHYAALHPEKALPGLYPAHGQDLVAGFVHKLPLFYGLDRVLKELFEDERRHPVSSREAASRRFFDVSGTVEGSNAFAVSPARTADGSTFLVVNSHQPWEGPVAWYEVHLKSEQGWDMVGGVFPGAPVVLHGHNRDLGWAHTVNQPDLLDVYVLQTDPENEDRYRFDGEWRTLEKRTAAIEVKLLGPLRWTFRREVLASVQGPAVRRPHGTYALRLASAGQVGQVEQWYRMNRARTFEEWNTAMSALQIPMFNTVYADHEGNVHYLYNGRLPLRSAAYDASEYLPGDTSEAVWHDFLPFEKLPQVTNPPSGFVQNSNSTPFMTTLGEGNPRPEDLPPGLGIETRMTNRSLRSMELFGADESLTFEELLDLKYDTAYSASSKMAELVRRAAALPRPDDPLLAEALDVLRDWDLDTGIENPRAALAVLAFGPFIGSGETGDGRTDDEILEAVAGAARSLHEHSGALEVTWGEVQRLRRGDADLAVGGGPDVLRAVYGRPGEDGRVTGVAGDSYVLAVAWDAEGRVRSRSIHQYGSATLDPSSPHYADQAELFVRREMKPVWLDEAEVRAHLEREYRPGEER